MKPYSLRILCIPLIACLLLLCTCNSAPNSKNETSDDISTEQKDNWQPLFNQKDLNGWHTLPGGTWEVQNGIIVGKSPVEEKLHGILLSDRQYADFKLRVIFKVLAGNSGLYFRVDKVENEESVNGFQAEIETGDETGGIYETGGRAWVAKSDPNKIQQWMKKDDWNEMIVIAKGKDVKVFLNGHQTVSLTDDPGRTKGHIGLQLHGSQEMHVMFRDVSIIEDPEDMEI